MKYIVAIIQPDRLEETLVAVRELITRDQVSAVVGPFVSRQAIPAGWTEWAGKGKAEDRKLASTNRAASINLSGPQRRPEGATLRRWEQ